MFSDILISIHHHIPHSSSFQCPEVLIQYIKHFSTITKLGKVVWCKDTVVHDNSRQMCLKNTMDPTCLPYQSLEKLLSHYSELITLPVVMWTTAYLPYGDLVSTLGCHTFNLMVERLLVLISLLTHLPKAYLDISLLFTGHIHPHIHLLTHTADMRHG